MVEIPGEKRVHRRKKRKLQMRMCFNFGHIRYHIKSVSMITSALLLLYGNTLMKIKLFICPKAHGNTCILPFSLWKPMNVENSTVIQAKATIAAINCVKRFLFMHWAISMLWILNFGKYLLLNRHLLECIHFPLCTTQTTLIHRNDRYEIRTQNRFLSSKI